MSMQTTAPTAPVIASHTATHEGATYAPWGAPAWSTVANAELESGMLAFLYGSDKTASADVPTLVRVYRSGRTVRFTDAATGRAVDECAASVKRWIASACNALTPAQASYCTRGFSSHSRRPDECRHCKRNVQKHSHADPADGVGRYDHWSIMFAPVMPGPVVIVCTDDTHREGIDGCSLPKCAGIPPLSALTSPGQAVPAEPYPGEYGTDTVGRALTLDLRDMTGAEVTMPIYADSQWCDTRSRRQVQGWTLVVVQGGRAVTITFLSFESRTALTLWRSVWCVLVNGQRVADSEGSALIETYGMTAPIMYATIAHRAACAIGARNAFGLRVDGWTLADEISGEAPAFLADAPAPVATPAPADVDASAPTSDQDGRNAFGLTGAAFAGHAVHVFDEDATGESVYDATQCVDSIRDGDLLHAPSLRLVGFLMEAWPCAVTAERAGLHRYATGQDSDRDARYLRIVADAVAYAQSLGYPIDGDASDTPDMPAPVDAAAPEAITVECTVRGGNGPETTRVTVGSARRPSWSEMATLVPGYVTGRVVDDPAGEVPAESDAAAPEVPAGALVASVDRRALTEALVYLARSVFRRGAPILTGVEITANGFDAVTLRTFDYDTERAVTLPADVTAAGRGAVGCKALQDVLKGNAMRDARVTLADTGAELAVSCGPVTLTMETLPVADMPSLGFTTDPVASLDVRTLAPALAVTATAACTDDTLPQFNAVQMSATDGALTMQATDRHRATFTSMATTGVRDVFLTPPARPIAEVAGAMAKHAGKAGAPIIIGDYGHQGFRWMSLTCGGYRFTGRMIDTDKLLPMRALIPDAMRTATVDTNALLNAVETLAIVIDDTFPVLLDWSDGMVTVRASGQRGIPVPAEYAGDPCTIAFKPAYLIDGLAPVKGRASLAIADGRKPMLIRPTDGAEAPAGYEYLVMPVRIDGAPAEASAPTNTDTDTDTREDATTMATTTPTRKSNARKSKATPAAEAPAPTVESDDTAPEAPTAPVILGEVERIAQRALDALNAGDFPAASTAIDDAEAGAPTGYLVAGKFTFDGLRAMVTERRAASVPAPAAPAVPVVARVYAPAILTHDTAGTALAQTPFPMRFKVSALLNVRRQGLGWTFDKVRKVWVMDGSTGQPIDVDRVARMVAVLAEIGVTVDDRTGTTYPEVPTSVAPVPAPAPAPAPVASARDTAVMDAARAVGVEILTANSSADDGPAPVVLDIPADVDTSAGYRPILLPVKQALTAAGVRMFVTHVGRRVTIAPATGVMTEALRTAVLSVLATVAADWTLALMASVSV